MTAVVDYTDAALVKALVKAQSQMPAVEANATNPHFKSQFVTLDHLIAKTKPVLTKNGLAIVQTPTFIDGQPALRTTLLHEASGAAITDVMPLILGKNDMQGLGAALTYARRYAWAAALGISDETDDDGNQASAQADGNSQRGTAGASRSAPAAPNSGPGTVVWKYGEHAGTSIADTPLAFLEEYAQTGGNKFMQGKVREYLTELELAAVGATEQSGFYAPARTDDDIPF